MQKIVGEYFNINYKSKSITAYKDEEKEGYLIDGNIMDAIEIHGLSGFINKLIIPNNVAFNYVYEQINELNSPKEIKISLMKI